MRVCSHVRMCVCVYVCMCVCVYECMCVCMYADARVLCACVSVCAGCTCDSNDCCKTPGQLRFFDLNRRAAPRNYKGYVLMLLAVCERVLCVSHVGSTGYCVILSGSAIKIEGAPAGAIIERVNVNWHVCRVRVQCLECALAQPKAWATCCWSRLGRTCIESNLGESQNA